MQYLDLACWLYQTDAGGILRLRFCACQPETPGVSTRDGVASSTSKAWRDFAKPQCWRPIRIKLPERISEAELALVLRNRKLFHAEGEQIEWATHGMNLLRSASPTIQSQRSASIFSAIASILVTLFQLRAVPVVFHNLSTDAQGSLDLPTPLGK
jgi:hypothetical protein